MMLDMNHTDDGPVSLAAPTTTQTIAQATARPPELLDLPDGFVLRRRTWRTPTRSTR